MLCWHSDRSVNPPLSAAQQNSPCAIFVLPHRQASLTASAQLSCAVGQADRPLPHTVLHISGVYCVSMKIGEKYWGNGGGFWKLALPKNALQVLRYAPLSAAGLAQQQPKSQESTWVQDTLRKVPAEHSDAVLTGWQPFCSTQHA